jgi:phosphomannomutase
MFLLEGRSIEGICSVMTRKLFGTDGIRGRANSFR